MLVPTGELAVASDHTRHIEAGNAQCVLWPNPTSRLLSRFMVPRPSSLTLDLGTGNGVLALLAAGHSEHVVATDLNRPGHGLRGFQCTPERHRKHRGTGGRYLRASQKPPVGFDPLRIRPFFITPATRYLFCDNPSGTRPDVPQLGAAGPVSLKRRRILPDASVNGPN